MPGASAPSCPPAAPGSGRPAGLGPAAGGSSASPHLAIFCASIRAVSSSSCRMSSMVRSVHSSCQHHAWRWARSITLRKPVTASGERARRDPGVPIPKSLPPPPLRAGRRSHPALTDIVDELLDLGLHPPVAELHLAEFVGAHQGPASGRLQPVVPQRPPARLGRVVELGVLLGLVLPRGDGVTHDVNGVWGKRSSTRYPSLLRQARNGEESGEKRTKIGPGAPRKLFPRALRSRWQCQRAPSPWL